MCIQQNPILVHPSFKNIHTNSFHYAVFRKHTYKFFSLGSISESYIQILFIMLYFINIHTNSFHYAVFRSKHELDCVLTYLLLHNYSSMLLPLTFDNIPFNMGKISHLQIEIVYDFGKED